MDKTHRWNLGDWGVVILPENGAWRPGIHMSDIPSFEYALLWGERCVRSVANLTREDGETFFNHRTVSSYNPCATVRIGSGQRGHRRTQVGRD